MGREGFFTRFWGIILVILAIVIFVLLVGPFIIPVPPLKNTVPPEQLADPDSKFISINGSKVHYKIVGEGTPALILLHGFGASTFTWHKVMEPLSREYLVIAYDRTGFGYSSRPLKGEWSGESPYSQESQARELVALMDALGVEKAVLVGSSAGGTTAALATVSYPERVKALILVDAAIFRGGPPGWLHYLLGSLHVKRIAPLLIRNYYGHFFNEIRARAWHDPSKQTEEILEGYKKSLRADNWDRALCEFGFAYQSLDLEKRLSSITVPVLVITGDDDRIVPSQDSARIAKEIPGAQRVVIRDAGHLPHEEKPEEFLKAVNSFLEKVL